MICFSRKIIPPKTMLKGGFERSIGPYLYHGGITFSKEFGRTVYIGSGEGDIVMPFLDDDLITVVGRHAFFLAKERTECATMLWRCNIEASVMRIDMTYDISSSLDRMTKCMASGKSLFASFNKIVDKDRARDRAYDTFLIPAYTFGLEEEIQGTKIHTQNIYGEISESHDAIIPHGILDIVPILRVGQTVVCSDKLWATMQSGLNFEYFTAWDAETGEPL